MFQLISSNHSNILTLLLPKALTADIICIHFNLYAFGHNILHAVNSAFSYIQACQLSGKGTSHGVMQVVEVYCYMMNKSLVFLIIIDVCDTCHGDISMKHTARSVNTRTFGQGSI